MATKLLRLVQDNKKKDGETGTGGTGARRKGGRDIETDELIQEQQQRIRDVEKHCEAYKKKVSDSIILCKPVSAVCSVYTDVQRVPVKFKVFSNDMN